MKDDEDHSPSEFYQYPDELEEQNEDENTAPKLRANSNVCYKPEGKKHIQ